MAAPAENPEPMQKNMIGLLQEVRSEALGSMATAEYTSWGEAPRAFDPLECLPENVSKEESAGEGSDWEAWPSAGEVVRQRREEMRIRDHKMLMDALSGQSSLSVVRRQLPPKAAPPLDGRCRPHSEGTGGARRRAAYAQTLMTPRARQQHVKVVHRHHHHHYHHHYVGGNENRRPSPRRPEGAGVQSGYLHGSFEYGAPVAKDAGASSPRGEETHVHYHRHEHTQEHEVPPNAIRLLHGGVSATPTASGTRAGRSLGNTGCERDGVAGPDTRLPRLG